MDLDIEKDSLDAMQEVLKNAPQLTDDSATASTHSKKHSKLKKRDSTFLYGNEVAEILKSSQTPEQKLTTVCNKYSEMLHANRKLMMAYKMAEGRITKMQQENEQCQQQRSKAVLARSRLENLCRELQKLNKAQKEEIDLKLRLEEEKRKEISATFQSAFAEMNTLTNQNTEKNTKMREENLEMREKIKSVKERIELSEQQLEKVRQQAQLELQLAAAKMAKVKMEMTAEKETLLKEKQQLLLKLTEYQVKIQELQATEVGLRSQISMYTEKYDDFQNALTKSNEVFSGFNEEMEKMSKKILKLEKETSLWKQRWEKSHAALLEMAADKQSRDAEMSKLTHKLSLLQELCKAFQKERTELLGQLRSAHLQNNERDKINKIDIQQVDDLSKDCQELKDNLVQLQDSLDDVIIESSNESVNDIKEINDKTDTEANAGVEIIKSDDEKNSVVEITDFNVIDEKEKCSLEEEHEGNLISTETIELSVNSRVEGTADIVDRGEEQTVGQQEILISLSGNEDVPLSGGGGEALPGNSGDKGEVGDTGEFQAHSGEEQCRETSKTSNSVKRGKDGKKKKR